MMKAHVTISKHFVALFCLCVFFVGALAQNAFTQQAPTEPASGKAQVGDPFSGIGLAAPDQPVRVQPQCASATGAIVQVDPGSLTCNGLITFDELGPEWSYTNHDTIIESGWADFAERFVGQTLSYFCVPPCEGFGLDGPSDVLSGTPTSPLTLQVGAVNQNLSVVTHNNTLVLDGLGPAGWPQFNAVGEGCFAVLFDFDQSEFGFDVVGSNDGGSATVNFYKRDGTLIESVILSNLTDISYGFRRVGEVNDIAGISIYNLDPGGIGFDNLCHDVPGVPGKPEIAVDIKPGSCPNPLNVKPTLDAWIGEGHDVLAAKMGPSLPPRPRAVVPVAILGTDDFDVSNVDPSTVELEGVSALRWNYGDVATPVEDTTECACTTLGPDWYMDLTLKFDRAAIIDVLGEVNDGDVIVLTLTGQLYDGTPFSGTDCVVIHAGSGSMAGTEDEKNDPATLDLANYPNPLNPKTEISFNLPAAGHVTLDVYNVMGQKVTTLVDGKLEAGHQTIEWDGSSVASGVYLYRLEAGGIAETKKMLLLK